MVGISYLLYMKRLYIIAIIIFSGNSVWSQNPTYQEKLFYTCKVWGFVKYYHSEVSTCQVNWDSVLVRYLPSIKNSVTNNDFNTVLDSILTAAGPMDIALSSFPDTLSTELKRNRDWSWINDTIFRSDIKVILDTIKNNFRPHVNCWVENNQYTNAYTGWLVFPYDSLMSNTNFNTVYPDEWNRLLVFFKYWNVVNYFNPYNYVQTTPWDSTLYSFSPAFANAPNYTAFCLLLQKVSANIDDAHAEAWSGSVIYRFPDNYQPPIIFKYIPTKYVVVKSNISGVAVGDELIAVNGVLVEDMEDSLKPYLSVGDSSVFRRYMSRYMLSGPNMSLVNATFVDSLSNSNTIQLTRNTYITSSFFTSYFPNDTLATVKWMEINCGVGYVNMGKLLITDVNQMYSDLQNTSSIIIDLRAYPNSTARFIYNVMSPDNNVFAKFLEPDVTYPGTFFWEADSAGFNGNTNSYAGHVILLVNEQTQSQGEFSCMMLQTLPNVTIVGSQTAGADGNITYFRMSQDIYGGFSSLGVFYPNGDSTQRIGIIPDTVIFPTQVGIRHGRDELLEKALNIAGCWLAVDEVTPADSMHTARVFPNPSLESAQLELSNFSDSQLSITVTDVSGRIVSRSLITNVPGSTQLVTLNTSAFDTGTYFITIMGDSQREVLKLIKK